MGTPATSRKTMQLDILQLNALNFKTTSNTNIPSSFVLYSVGNGTTTFGSISSLVNLGYTTVSVPGQVTINAADSSEILTLSTLTSDIYISTNKANSLVWFGLPYLTSTINSTILSSINYMLPSTFDGTSNVLQANINTANAITNSNITNVVASTMYNILSYPNICSTIKYYGNNGLTPFQELPDITISGTANFSSLQYNFSNFTQYINPNGSSRVFIDYNPNFTFSHMEAPSSISSIALYPENSSIKNLLSLSSHFVYYETGQTLPIDKSGIQQYMPITALQPFGLSTNTRILSNTFIQSMTMELDSSLLLNNNAIGLKHYVSDAVVYKTSTAEGDDVLRTGLEKSDVQINIENDTKNNVFIRIVNSGNQV